MNAKTLIMCAVICVAGAAVAQTPTETEAPTSRRAAAAEWTADGLQQVKVQGLDLVYLAPGASLQGYASVLIDPVSVSFSRDFRFQTRPGSRMHWSAKDMQRIRDRLTTALLDEAKQVLTKGGQAVVDVPGEDVLRIDVKITNLNINAPLASEQMGRTYSVSAGNMTLVAELSDSVSGAVLARVYDYDEARESVARRITDVENEAEARAMVREWAQILLAQLAGAKQAQPQS